MRGLTLGLMCVIFFASCKNDGQEIKMVELMDQISFREKIYDIEKVSQVFSGDPANGIELLISAREGIELKFLMRTGTSEKIEEGTYTYSSQTDAFTFTDARIKLEGSQVSIPEGTVKIYLSGDVYTLDLKCRTDQDAEILGSWKGKIVYVDESPSIEDAGYMIFNGERFEIRGAAQKIEGDCYMISKNNIDIDFVFDEECLLRLCTVTDVIDGLPEGTYRLEDWRSVSKCIYDVYCIVNDELIPIEEGSLDVQISGDIFTLKIDMEDTDGRVLELNYEGRLPLTNNVPASTGTGSYTLDGKEYPILISVFEETGKLSGGGEVKAIFYDITFADDNFFGLFKVGVTARPSDGDSFIPVGKYVADDEPVETEEGFIIDYIIGAPEPKVSFYSRNAELDITYENDNYTVTIQGTTLDGYDLRLNYTGKITEVFPDMIEY